MIPEFATRVNGMYLHCKSCPALMWHQKQPPTSWAHAHVQRRVSGHRAPFHRQSSSSGSVGCTVAAVFLNFKVSCRQVDVGHVDKSRITPRVTADGSGVGRFDQARTRGPFSASQCSRRRSPKGVACTLQDLR